MFFLSINFCIGPNQTCVTPYLRVVSLSVKNGEVGVSPLEYVVCKFELLGEFLFVYLARCIDNLCNQELCVVSYL